MKQDFKEFLEGNNEVPNHVSKNTLEHVSISLRPQKLLFKFYVLNIAGAMLTLIICPQYGIGPFGGEFGLIQKIMELGPIWCGIFCSSLFFAGGCVLSSLFLNRNQRLWIYKHEFSVLTPYISILFVIAMGLKNIVNGHFHHDVFAYHASWIFGALFFSFLFYKLVSKFNVNHKASA
jgi:hypothetical protein